LLAWAIFIVLDAVSTHILLTNVTGAYEKNVGAKALMDVYGLSTGLILFDIKIFIINGLLVCAPFLIVWMFERGCVDGFTWKETLTVNKIKNIATLLPAPYVVWLIYQNGYVGAFNNIALCVQYGVGLK
jgi:hypothetical protein